MKFRATNPKRSKHYLILYFLPICLIQVCIWTWFLMYNVLQQSEQFDHLEMLGSKTGVR